MKTSAFGNRWLFRLLYILLALCLISSAMVSRLYARYTSSAAGSSSARVAAFDVREAGELTAFFSKALAPGQTEKVSVTVTNNSEVAVLYTVEVENVHNNLPLTFAINGQNLPYGAQIPCGKDNVQTLELLISWPEEANDISYAGKVDLIKVTLNVTQMD